MNRVLRLGILASLLYASLGASDKKIETCCPCTGCTCVSTQKSVPEKTASKKPIPVLILIALPGSGKSEIRKYLNSIPLEKRIEEFHVGTMAELDDFPYVFFMRRASEEAIKLGLDGFFFLSPALPFREPRDWGTLTHLLNDDYADIVNNKIASAPKSAAQWLFDRIDTARKKVGAAPVFSTLSRDIKTSLEKAVEKDARKIFDEKVAEIKKAATIKERTVVIEFSRGGADSAPFPLPKPYGYQYTLSELSPALLDNASILYVWVTPEESRRKNDARANPNDPGSVLNHCVPKAVMYTEYGCDDIDWLLQHTDKAHTVRITKNGKIWHVPLARFDNRQDKTTFVHGEKAQWQQKDILALHDGLAEAFSHMHS
jgi:hypothetical protein